MRPSIYQICDAVEELFWRVRPSGKGPIDGAFLAIDQTRSAALVCHWSPLAVPCHVPCLSCPGGTVKMQGWALRRLVTEFARAARRPHVPREAGMRNLFLTAGIPLPAGADGYLT